MAERLLTLAEVAGQLRVSRWTVQRRLDEHPEIRRYKPGRSVLLDEHGYRQLKAALECPSKPSRPEPEKIEPGISGAPSTGNASKSAPISRPTQRRGKYAWLRKKLNASSESSNVVCLDRVTR